MNQIQEEIAKALVQLCEKTLITEAVLAKKLRENLKFTGKNKAGLAFQDIEEALFFIEENNSLHFALHLNSANDLLIKSSDKASGLEADARKRRLASEKSLPLISNSDVKSAREGKKTSGGKPYKKRTEKTRLRTNTDYED